MKKRMHSFHVKKNEFTDDSYPTSPYDKIFVFH